MKSYNSRERNSRRTTLEQLNPRTELDEVREQYRRNRSNDHGIFPCDREAEPEKDGDLQCEARRRPSPRRRKAITEEKE